MKDKLVKQLRRDEGEVLTAYQDHLGYWTLGVGRLIDARKGGGITPEESAYLLSNDIDKCLQSLEQALPWFKDLDEARKGALANMRFQLGLKGLLGFKNSLEMIRQGRYSEAGENLKDSLWYKQTPGRALRVINQIVKGEWQ